MKSFWRNLSIAVFASSMLVAGSGALAADDETQEIRQHPAVAKANWAEVIEVLVELGDNNYEPNELKLKIGMPYKLRLKNMGNASHDMVGGTFFSPEVIALKMVNTRVGRVSADNINAIYIRPKNEAELWFVPLKKGEFSFVCSIPGHADSGMTGTVIIGD